MPGFNIGGSGTGRGNAVETSRRHRFLVRIFNPLSTDLLFFARKVQVPSTEIDRIVMHHKQEEIGLPGKHRVTPGEINFYRAHDNNGDQAAWEIYSWWSSMFLVVDDSSILADDAGQLLKRDIEVHVLDGAGNTVHQYLMLGAWPQKITPDTFDMTDNNVAEIVVSLSVDKVQEKRGDAVMATHPGMCESDQGSAQPSRGGILVGN